MSAIPAFVPPLRAVLRQPATKSTTRYLHHLLRPQQPVCPKTTRSIYSNLRQVQHRNASTLTGDARRLFRKHPFSISLASLTILVGAGGLVYVNWYYQAVILGAYHNYPEPVAQKLRRAVYFSISDIQPKEALKYYRQALQVAEEIGMDPFSDEIVGVKIRVAALMESVDQYGKAVQVLEILKNDILEYLDRFGGLEQNKKKRTRLLEKTIQISVKLGELYGSPAIWDREMAEERLVWAVETALKEKHRRATNNISEEEEGHWINDDEFGASLEALAHNYEQKDQHYLATPLFLQALALHRTGCHSVILMNNLATSLAQQSPSTVRATQQYISSQTIKNHGAPAGPPVTRETTIENARAWAQKALEVAADIRPPDRDDECDVGCAVATHNLGEFAEMLDDIAGAKQRYEEAISISRAIGFQEGVEKGSARLRKLKAS